MKKVVLNRMIALLTVIIPLIFLATEVQSQIVTDSTKRRISIAFGLSNDFWMNQPADMKVRAINQGVQVLGMYNMPFGKSRMSFAIGLGVSVHNLYWNYLYKGGVDSLQFTKINDTLDYKRSKLTLPYLELPVELRLKTKSHVAVGVGFKVGYMIYGHSKYVGEDYIFKSTNTLKASFKDIKNIERFAYGPTLRVGYKWFHVYGYYQLSSIFSKGKGPDMYPITVGFLLMPF